MENYLLTATNPNVIVINNFWVGVFLTLAITSGMIYFGFKYNYFQVPKIISAGEFFRNLADIINARATNEGIVNEYIEEARDVRDSLRRFSEKYGNSQKIVNAINNMPRSHGDFKMDELVELTDDMTSLSSLVSRSVGMAMENINYRKNYSENRKVPKTTRVEVDNGTRWQYVDDRYASPKPEEKPDFQPFMKKFMTDEELNKMRQQGGVVKMEVDENTYFDVQLRDGTTKKMIGKDINAIQNHPDPNVRRILGYHFIIVKKS